MSSPAIYPYQPPRSPGQSPIALNGQTTSAQHPLNTLPLPYQSQQQQLKVWRVSQEAMPTPFIIYDLPSVFFGDAMHSGAIVSYALLGGGGRAEGNDTPAAVKGLVSAGGFGRHSLIIPSSNISECRRPKRSSSVSYAYGTN